MNEIQIFKLIIVHRMSLWISFFIFIAMIALIDGTLLRITSGKSMVSEEYDIFIFAFVGILFASFLIYYNLKNNPYDINKHLFWLGLILTIFGLVGIGNVLLNDNELNKLLTLSDNNKYNIISIIFFYTVPFLLGLFFSFKYLKLVPNTLKNKIITILILILYSLVIFSIIDENKTFLTIKNQIFIVLSLIFIIKIFITISKNKIMLNEDDK